MLLPNLFAKSSAPALTTVGGFAEAEYRSRLFNRAEAFIAMGLLLAALWWIVHPFAVLQEQRAASAIGVTIIALVGIWCLFVSPRLHGDTLASWGVGDPRQLWQELRAAMQTKGKRVWLWLFLLLNIAVWAIFVAMFDKAVVFLVKTNQQATLTFFTTPFGWFLRFFISLILTFVATVVVMRYDNFVSALKPALIGIVMLGGIELLATCIWPASKELRDKQWFLAMIGYIAWGAMQQILFCGYFGNRLRKGFAPAASSPRRAAFKRFGVACLSGMFFGLIHIPSWNLVLFTIILGIYLSWFFMDDRYRNLLALSLIHAVLGTLTRVFFAGSVHMSVGPWNAGDQGLWWEGNIVAAGITAWVLGIGLFMALPALLHRVNAGNDDEKSVFYYAFALLLCLACLHHSVFFSAGQRLAGSLEHSRACNFVAEYRHLGLCGYHDSAPTAISSPVLQLAYSEMRWGMSLLYGFFRWYGVPVAIAFVWLLVAVALLNSLAMLLCLRQLGLSRAWALAMTVAATAFSSVLMSLDHIPSLPLFPALFCFYCIVRYAGEQKRRQLAGVGLFLLASYAFTPDFAWQAALLIASAVLFFGLHRHIAKLFAARPALLNTVAAVVTAVLLVGVWLGEPVGSYAMSQLRGNIVIEKSEAQGGQRLVLWTPPSEVRLRKIKGEVHSGKANDSSPRAFVGDGRLDKHTRAWLTAVQPKESLSFQHGETSRVSFLFAGDTVPVARGQVLTLTAYVANRTKKSWPNVDREAKYPVRIGLRWCRRGDPEYPLGEARLELPCTLHAGDIAQVKGYVPMVNYKGEPLQAGHYDLLLCVMQEKLLWLPLIADNYDVIPVIAISAKNK
jgi:hypothetical protein